MYSIMVRSIHYEKKSDGKNWPLFNIKSTPHTTPPIFFNFQKLQFRKIGKFFSHFKSMATLAEAGAEMLLLEAWHVSVAPKSSRLTWGTDRVF